MMKASLGASGLQIVGTRPSSSPSQTGSTTSRMSLAGPSGGGSADTAAVLSGMPGVSPFTCLASMPDLPVSSQSSSYDRMGGQQRPGLSLRRNNSTSNTATAAAAGSTGGAAPAPGALGRATSSGGGLGGARTVRATLWRTFLALMAFQVVLGYVLLIVRPDWAWDVAARVGGPLGLSGPSSRWHAATARAQHAARAAYVESSRARAAYYGLPKPEFGEHGGANSAASRRERLWGSGDAAKGGAQQTQQQRQATDKAAPQSVRLATTQQQQQQQQATAASAAKKDVAAAAAVALAAGAGDAKAKADAAAAAAGSAAAKAILTAAKTAGAAAGGAASPPGFPPFAQPVVPYAGRMASPPPLVGVVFYGRRSRVRILDCYLQRNMRHAGGLLREVVFVSATWDAADVAFLDRLVAARQPDYRKLIPQRVDKGYTGHYLWMDPQQIYVKIDDDVVYVGDHALDHMLAAHLLNRYHLISANVINHQPLEVLHSKTGAHTTYEQATPGNKASWRPLMRRPAGAPADAAPVAVPFVDNGWDVWGDWKRAANVHYSFLANHAAGKLGLYEFPDGQQLWDFNKHIGYTRWRINMIMFKASAIDAHVFNMSTTTGTYPGDDEDYITRILPQQLNATSAAVSAALAVHFSFYTQRGGLENSTDLLDRYAVLAERTCGRLLPA